MGSGGPGGAVLPKTATHSWMNHFRRLLTRWDKTAKHYLAFVQLACLLILWRKFAPLSGQAINQCRSVQDTPHTKLPSLLSTLGKTPEWKSVTATRYSSFFAPLNPEEIKLL